MMDYFATKSTKAALEPFFFLLMNYFQSDTKTMTTEVLTTGRFTVYAHIGDVFVYFCIAFLAAVLLRCVQKKYHVNPCSLCYILFKDKKFF